MKKLMMTALALVVLSGTAFSQYKKAMKSGTLNILEVNDVTVEGYEGSELIIETNKHFKIPERAKGLKPLNGMGLTDNTDIGLAVTEEGDMLIVQQVSRNQDAQYVIKVPKGVMVRYTNSSIHGDDFRASDIANEMEVQTNGGDIKLINVTGPVSLSSVHGDIEVIFEKLAEKLPSSIASVHGDVDVSLAASTNANMKIKTTWGEVYTDMDIKVNQTSDMKVYGAKSINGTLNAGGVNLAVSSTHGSVYLRKK